VRWQHNLLLSLRWQPFYAVQLNAHHEKLGPFSVHSPSDISTCLDLLLTQTSRTLITHFSNSVYRKRRKKNFISLVCAMCPYAYWQTTRDAGQQHVQPNTENIWNSSLVTKSMPLFINIQTRLWFAYLFNIDSTVQLISVERSVNFTDDSRRTGKDCHVTMPSRRQGTRNSAPRQGGSRSCICGTFERVVWRKKRHD